MNSRDRFVGLLLGLAGTGLCLAALATFFSTIVHNRWGWTRDQSAQDYYLAVGRAYSQGFAVGFFLCFFLALMALVLRAWVVARRGGDDAPMFDYEDDDGLPEPVRSSPTLAPGREG